MFELTPRQRELRAQAEALAAAVVAPQAAETDRSEIYPWPVVRALAEAGFMGMTVPKALGGPGLGLIEVVLVIEAIAKACCTSGRIVVDSNLGALGAVLCYGNDAMQRLWAERVLAGDKPAICITEPEAGSDAGAMTTTAERKGDRWVLNGTKHWITGGGVSGLHLIFARVIEDGAPQGIAAFVALQGEDGLVVGEREPAMGARGLPETRLHCRELALPLDRMVVPPEGPKAGLKRLLDAYNGQRVGAATVALGVAQGAFEEAVAYTQGRRQFGHAIADFQGLRWMLADMATSLEASRLLIHQAAHSAGERGFPDPRLAAQAKIFAAEAAIKVTNDALQLAGSAGYSRHNPFERRVRDARMFAIAGGTAQVLRNLVANRVLADRSGAARLRAAS
ncbi:MAG: acyl-CoA dehydrogenase [Geminicoccaceae bacterium]|nr:MAG: acyl-CoA dehydrogenase [Geminicoccaceae bacterium]